MAKKRKTPTPSKGKKLRPFHQFSRLPYDLRPRVWDLVDPEPRIVELRPYRGENNYGPVQQIRCLTRAPAILHVCREARRNAIKRQLYQQAFFLGENSTWVNFDVDMISIKPIEFEWVEAEKSLIQRLRFEGENDEGFLHFRSHRVKKLFTKLRELQIVCEEGVVHWINIAEEYFFGTENVFFINKGFGTRMYSRNQLLNLYPSRPWPEYSSSYYRQMFDKRIKGRAYERPEDFF